MMWNYNQNFPFGMMGWQGLWFITPLLVLEIVLKGFALWRAARKEEQWWFVALLVLNTAGILPAIYLLLKKNK